MSPVIIEITTVSLTFVGCYVWTPGQALPVDRSQADENPGAYQKLGNELPPVSQQTLLFSFKNLFHTVYFDVFPLLVPPRSYPPILIFSLKTKQSKTKAQTKPNKTNKVKMPK